MIFIMLNYPYLQVWNCYANDYFHIHARENSSITNGLCTGFLLDHMCTQLAEQEKHLPGTIWDTSHNITLGILL